MSILCCVALILTGFSHLSSRAVRDSSQEDANRTTMTESEPDLSQPQEESLLDPSPPQQKEAGIMEPLNASFLRGRTSSHFTAGQAMRSSIGSFSRPPHMTVLNDESIYDTMYGCFHFSHKHPESMSVTDCQGRTSVLSSRFGVYSSLGELSEGDSYISSRTDLSFVSLTELWLRGKSAGFLKITTGFYSDRSPKITVEYDRDANTPHLDIFIAWRVLSSSRYVSSGSSAIVDSNLMRTGERTELTGMTVRFCNDPDTCDHSPTGVMDWSDAGAGSAEASKVADSKGGNLWEVLVSFPLNEELIDPTILAYASNQDATAAEPQRKTFFSLGYYFAFFHSYRWIMIVSSKDGEDWAPAGSYYPWGG